MPHDQDCACETVELYLVVLAEIGMPVV